jgi:uracil-DNA glycosylase, family 4
LNVAGSKFLEKGVFRHLRISYPCCMNKIQHDIIEREGNGFGWGGNDMRASWKELYHQTAHCTKCELHQQRTHVAVDDGNRNSKIMLVGEGPGEQEDKQGIPFVGPAGKLLDRMLAAIELTRDDVYICNVVKCRPPKNRTPFPEEVESCIPFLREQFVLTQPRIIVCLGATAAKALISSDMRITRERGMWTERQGIWMLPTYHPAALLRDTAKKADAWIDMQALQKKIGELQI